MNSEVFYFDTREEATEFLAKEMVYRDPPSVVPLKGSAAHEVAVGPVHAGVIEPGHFRFQCMGEDVYNLQIFLGYQHRDVENRIVEAAQKNNLARQIALVEMCAGDTSIAAATAFAKIYECANLAPEASDHDEKIREILLELERIANHIGDLGALAGDVAFLPTASFCGRIRGDYLNLTAHLCGNRFGRAAVVPGGLRIACTAEKLSFIRTRLTTLKPELDHALSLMFEEPTVLERFEGTGVVSKADAASLGLVGVARRASDEFAGDVLSRARVRQIEIDEAHAKIAKILDALDNRENSRENKIRENSEIDNREFFAIRETVAAWRGPLTHVALFDRSRALIAYKIIDPSAYNWQGLAWALRGEQISNFPICNKSFNLSYCGTDR